MSEMHTPTPCSVGFENLPLSAQALFFHLSMRAHEDGTIDAVSAALIRKRIGASDEDVGALVRNRFVVEKPGGGQLQIETEATYPSLVVNDGQEDVILYMFHREAIWRQTVAAYEKEWKERYERSSCAEY